MKKKIAKLLALGMSIALVFSLAACGGNDLGPSTEPDTAAGAFVVDDAEPASDDVSAPSGESNSDTQATGQETPNTPNTPDTPAEETGIKMPTNMNELVSLYNSAVAQSGFTKASVTREWVSSDVTIVGDLNKLSKGEVARMFNATVDYSCKPGNISAGDIASATPKSSGNSIILSITLKDRNNVSASGAAYGQYSYPYFYTYSDVAALVSEIGGALNVPVTLQEAGSSYSVSGGTIEATIDRTSGKMTALKTSFTEAMNGKASAAGLNVNATITAKGTANFK